MSFECANSVVKKNEIGRELKGIQPSIGEESTKTISKFQVNCIYPPYSC